MSGRLATATVLFTTFALGPQSTSLAAETTHHVTSAPAHCHAGAHTLSKPGSRVYPDVGNGGYRSVHTAVRLVYDNATNRFLAGNRVVMRDKATQCLTSFSLDFERRSINSTTGPDLTVDSVQVDGQPATWRFVRPTYPGDPHGMSDPDPRAHQAGQSYQVRGPNHNPLPPACTPEIPNGQSPLDARNGTMCPKNKLVITPAHVIKAGQPFTVSVGYTGRPGVHNEGDGTTDGWFRASDGGFVTTEPMGTEDWMPLNNFPAAKPTYDFYDTVPAGATAICNGILVKTTSHKPSQLFPNGSTTFHWHAGSRVASYLVENSVGDYVLSEHTVGGIRYYVAQDKHITAAQQRANAAIIRKQQAITRFESHFSGPYPFASDGVVVGKPPASFEEEMQTMITFAGGGPVYEATLYHENMHQWWGDNVSEGSFSMTFFKEGLATLAVFLYDARRAEEHAGGPATTAGRRAFERSLRRTFNANYRQGGAFWTHAPSRPSAATLFDGDPTYLRPATAYLALRQILGPTRFDKALRAIQRRYGGRSITEPQLEAVYHRWLPRRSAACESRLTVFFHQWFDTAYRSGRTPQRPSITGPGLDGTNFYGNGGCTV